MDLSSRFGLGKIKRDLPGDRLLYRLKRRWHDGTTHVIYEPLELMERLAALVPPPRFNVTGTTECLLPPRLSGP